MAGLQVGTVGGGPTVRVARPGLGTGAVSLGGGDLSALPAILSKLRADENSLQIQPTMVTRFSRFARRAVYNRSKQLPFREDSDLCKMRDDRVSSSPQSKSRAGADPCTQMQIGSGRVTPAPSCQIGSCRGLTPAPVSASGLSASRCHL
jgi:hypothetical protein